jgi:hypothetical protein
LPETISRAFPTPANNDVCQIQNQVQRKKDLDDIYICCPEKVRPT